MLCMLRATPTWKEWATSEDKVVLLGRLYQVSTLHLIAALPRTPFRRSQLDIRIGERTHA